MNIHSFVGESSMQVLIIIIAVASVVVLIIIIMAIFCCFRRRKRQKQGSLYAEQGCNLMQLMHCLDPFTSMF